MTRKSKDSSPKRSHRIRRRMAAKSVRGIRHLRHLEQRAAGVMLEEFVKATGAKSRGAVERDDMTGFNWSTRPVILVELGFMSNAEEDRLMETPEYQEKRVEEICRGVARAVGITNETK